MSTENSTLSEPGFLAELPRTPTPVAITQLLAMSSASSAIAHCANHALLAAFAQGIPSAVAGLSPEVTYALHNVAVSLLYSISSRKDLRAIGPDVAEDELAKPGLSVRVVYALTRYGDNSIPPLQSLAIDRRPGPRKTSPRHRVEAVSRSSTTKSWAARYSRGETHQVLYAREWSD